MTPDTAVYLFLNGLTNGAIYALLGLGIVLIYNVTRVINIAQGEFVMLGAMTAIGLTTGTSAGGIQLAIAGGVAWLLFEAIQRRIWWLIAAALVAGGFLWWLVDWATPFHLPPLLAAVVAVIVVAFLGAAIYRVTIQPVARANELLFFVITAGLYLGLQGLGFLFWGSQSFTFPKIDEGSVALGPMRLSYQSILVFVVALVLLLLVWLFLERTLRGKALRAAAMNHLGARLVGVSPAHAGLIAFAVSAGLSAIAGILIAPITFATYDMGLFLGLKGFVGAIVGGLSGYTGAVVGGLLVGVLESYAFFGLSAYGEAIVYALIIVVLFVRAITVRKGRVA